MTLWFKRVPAQRQPPAVERLEQRVLLAYDVEFGSYLGGGAAEQTRDVAFDSQGYLYVVGGTTSADFPATAGAFDDGHNGNMDAYAAKYSPSGEIIWATYIGGRNYDRAYAVEVDADGSVYVAGRAGAEFPTTAGSLQPGFAGDSNPNPIYGPQDGFIAKLSPDGGSLVWSTYFGENSRGFIRDIALDALGNVYLAFTESDAPVPHVTPGAYQTTRGGGKDGVVAKIKGDGSAVVWASYLGGGGDDLLPPSIRVDGDGYVYVVGATTSTDLATTEGAYDRTHNGGDDMLVAKFKPDGSGLVYLTYLGGSGDDFTETHQLAVDAAGNAYIATTTTSANFPTTEGAYDRTYNGTGGNGGGAGTNYPGDVHLSKLSVDGTQLLAGTFVGGSAGEGVEGLGVDAAGNVYFSGTTFSSDMPTTGDAYQTGYSGSADGFAGVLAGDFSRLLYLTYLGGSGNDATRTLVAHADGRFAVGGETNSTDYPVHDAQQPDRRGEWDGSLVAFAPRVLPPEVRVRQGDVELADGAGMVSFGSVRVGQAAPEMTFTIENTGSGPLAIGQVVLENNVGFEVVRQPEGTLAPGAATTFTIRMLSATAGAASAGMRFDTNDADENPFDLSLAGTVTEAATLVVSGTAEADRIYVKRVGEEVHVWVNADEATSPPTHVAALADLDGFRINAGDGDDRITLDVSGGEPTPAAGLVVAGDVGADRLVVVCTPADDTVGFDGAVLTIGSGAGVSVGDVEAAEIAASGGTDSLTFTGNAVVALVGGHTLASLDIAGSAKAMLTSGALSTAALTISEQGLLDVADNELILRTTAETKDAMLAALVAAIRTAREATPAWSGPGITSSAAMADPLVGLGTYVGRPDADSILVKRGYNGDANGDGKVNADDYFRIDSGFLDQPQNPTYAQGDFNYDKKINADDYFLIDSAFLGQAAPAAVASAASSAVAGGGPVVEQDSKRARSRTRARVTVFNGVTRFTRSRG